MTLSSGGSGAIRVMRAGCSCLQAARVALLDGPEIFRRRFTSSMQRRHHEVLHTSVSSSDQPEGSPGPTAAGIPHHQMTGSWPADITDRIRQLQSETNFTTKPLRRSPNDIDNGVDNFISGGDMQRQLQADAAHALWSRVKGALSGPLSGVVAPTVDSFGELGGPAKGSVSPPIVYKQHIDGMTAAHHYPSRLLPAGDSSKIPPLLYVTAFDLQGGSDPSGHSGALGFREAGLFRGPTGIQAKTTLVERLYGRVSLLFLFDLGSQNSQMADVASWLRHLERYPSFISAVYGPVFAAAAGRSPQNRQLYLAFGTDAASTPELASISYICVDHAPFWLRSLAIRSMRRLSPSFHPLSPFHDFPHRLRLAGATASGGPLRDLLGGPNAVDEGLVRRLAEDYHRLCSLIGTQATTGTLIGSFLGYSGKWGAQETEALKRRQRHNCVTVLLVDRGARVRWHATGLPTEEAVLLLLSGLKTLMVEKEQAAKRQPRVHT